jgi:cytochrome c oxidase subunit 1
MLSYWAYLTGAIVMMTGFFVPGGAANSGWTSYAPLSVIATTGQTVWLLGMVFLITSSLLGSVNFIVTIIQLRAKGLTMFRLPVFVWAQFVTSFLLLLAFPPLEAAAVLQLMDRLVGTSFFMPEGLVVSGQLQSYAGGGSPLLWQHLFWFLAHPEVYVLILPGLGMIAEFIVWAHHMFITGMGTKISTFFATTTMIISIPSVIILTAMVISLYQGAIRFTVPMLFALAFLPMFAIGGLTGLPLGLPASDIQLHDTYYVIGHFHYVVAPGTIFAIFAGVYFWYPKVTGRTMNTALGWMHFVLSFIFINVVFMPMFFQGLAGVSRRLYDQTQYAHGSAVQSLTKMSSWGAWMLGLSQLPFILNFFMSIRAGRKVSDNPWDATTLEWAAPSPPPHGNFVSEPVVYRDPYDYSPRGVARDFLPQHVAEA